MTGSGRAWRALVLIAMGACQPRSKSSGAMPPGTSDALARINHIVVIYLENRSFDNLYGGFEGAEGLAAARGARPQVNEHGVPYRVLPQAPGTPFPTDLPNAPFEISRFVPPTAPTRDLVHRFYQEQVQIHGGRMDRFAVVSDAQGLVMGYYRTADLPLAALAQEFTLCDRLFHSAFGGSFLNHQWLIAARTPEFRDAPASMRALLDSAGLPTRDGAVTPDGFVVNTAYSVQGPRPSSAAPNDLMPALTNPTIGDRLDDKGLSWAWYAGGWTAADSGRPGEDFQFHHQPFVYFAKFAEGSAARREHLKDEDAFIEAARSGTLPAVAFVKPAGLDNEHPGYADVIRGERHVRALIDDVRNGPNWHDTVIIVTYDENGGLWDHVAPPHIDRWGPGTRVPTIIISPFARRGFVDHTVYETVSILALMEKRWGLAPLTERDAGAAPLEGFLRVSEPGSASRPMPGAPALPRSR
ncbi:MAG TPA: alkaline phosphatase family protein [Gemmatimonadaceae bacterium]|nr:alkaline phosphatase family protein [Gemmatimonadaceae bacterium]